MSNDEKVVQVLGKVGLKFIEEGYSASRTFKYLDWIKVDNDSYFMKKNECKGIPVTNTEYWEKFIHNPKKGTDYWTAEEIQAVINQINSTTEAGEAATRANAAAEAAEDATDDLTNLLNKWDSDKIEIDNRLKLLENRIDVSSLNWEEIQTIVKAGQADKYFNIGDQLTVSWKDTAANKEYEIPLDVVSFEDVTILDENEQEKVVPGMILQWHYCTPFGVQFSQNQAFYYCKELLPAGTYYFVIGENWGNNCHKDYAYEFTTTKDIPAGGQLQIGRDGTEIGACPDQNPSTWRVRTYNSCNDVTPLEILTLIEHEDGNANGTLLGTTTSTLKYNEDSINNLYSSSYGHNRWKTSALRQFLNSDADIGEWWSNQGDVFDRKPNELATKNGFMSGFEKDFLAVLNPVKVSTLINTTRDSQLGTIDDTYDTFFLPSLEQCYCVPFAEGEGKNWDYWKQKSNTENPNSRGSTNANLITYAVENHASAQTVRLRSAYRGYANNTSCISSTGHVYGIIATGSNRFSPACVIC